MNLVANQNKKETVAPQSTLARHDSAESKHKKCGAEVLAITKGNLTPCKCGAISVDGSKELVRVLGNPEDYEEIQK